MSYDGLLTWRGDTLYINGFQIDDEMLGAMRDGDRDALIAEMQVEISLRHAYLDRYLLWLDNVK